MGAKKQLRKLDKLIAEVLELQTEVADLLSALYEDRIHLAMRLTKKIPKPRDKEE